jgi:biopolymer transport protein ExbD
MITAPLMSHSITVDLPTANPKTKDAEVLTPPIDLALKADGTMYFNDKPLDSVIELKSKLLVEAQKTPQPELQIRADKTTEFKLIKKVIGTAKDSGMVHVGFMTTDAPKG